MARAFQGPELVLEAVHHCCADDSQEGSILQAQDRMSQLQDITISCLTPDKSHACLMPMHLDFQIQAFPDAPRAICLRYDRCFNLQHMPHLRVHLLPSCGKHLIKPCNVAGALRAGSQHENSAFARASVHLLGPQAPAKPWALLPLAQLPLDHAPAGAGDHRPALSGCT